MVIFPLAFMGLVLAWLCYRLVWVPGWSPRWLRITVPLLLVTLTGLAFLQFGAGPTFLEPDTVRPLIAVGSVWLAVLFYLMLALPAVALVVWVVGLLRREQRTERRRAVHRVAVPIAVVGAVVVTALGFRSAANPTLTEVESVSPDLPAAFDGLRVAVVTDVHAGPVLSADFTEQVVDLVNEADPDLVVLAGDLFDGPEWRYGPEIDPLADLEAPLGVFAVTGNHDTYTETPAEWEDRLTELGVRSINNTAVPLERDGEQIWLLGVHDADGSGDLAPDYERAVEGVGQADYALLAAHQPRAALEVPEGLVDLQVSGHTHGGQLWPVRHLVPVQQPMVDGTAVIHGIEVVTSRGAGNWGPPVRVGAAPEVPVITLRRG